MKLVNKFKLGRLLINLHVQAVDTAGKGKEIAIVSHGVVLQHFLYVLENDSADPSVKTGLCRR